MSVNANQPEIPVLLLYNLETDWPVADQKEVTRVSSQMVAAVTGEDFRVVSVPVTDRNLDKILSENNPEECLVFNWCEGLPGLDHSEWLAAESLEKKGFTFTGASSSALSLAQDKRRVKRLLDASGITTPRWRTLATDSVHGWDCFPAIVKPCREHCSEGIDRNAVVTSPAELKKRVGYIIETFRQPALVEDFIDGRELHVSLWGDGTIEMLPPAEMEFSAFQDEHDRLCTYEAKFVPESDHYRKIETLLPAPLTGEELRRVEHLCKAAYRITGCRDYARIDMRMRGRDLYVIDVNPNSDISPDTSTVSAAELAGYGYGDFGRRILSFAARRHPALTGQGPVVSGTGKGID